MSIRVQQLTCQSVTKTKDNVQLTVSVAVQYQAVRERVDDAYYKLSNVESQISSYVDDAVRSALPTLTLDEAFETKDHVAEQVKSGLEVRGSFTVLAAVAPKAALYAHSHRERASFARAFSFLRAQEQMSHYGFFIIKALVTDLSPAAGPASHGPKRT